MRVVTIVGARPQFVKLAPVSRAMADESVTGGTPIEDIIVHTGQHYDAGMSDVFFDELDIPKPGVHLGVGSGSHGAQTAAMLEGIEKTLLEHRPDMVVIYGDTNSTLAGAIAAAKLRIPIAHVEAGLRSFNRDMPEEINRVVADHVSDLLFAPTETAMRNLETENLKGHAIKSGDVMLDAVEYNLDLAERRSSVLTDLDLNGADYAIATLHRASNTDGGNLEKLLDAFNTIASDVMPIVFPVHPRTVARLGAGSGWKAAPRLKMIEPLGYLDMLKLLRNARMVLTDSGGVQKEALFVGTPCVTLRDETEWPETVDAGGNVLTGAEPARVIEAVDHWLGADEVGPERIASTAAKPFGDGRAAAAIVRGILDYV